MTRTRFVLALLLALASLAAHAPSTLAQSSGTTYYVAQTAGASDSNPGTAAAPLRTINAAVAKAVAGDAISVGAGTYAEAVSIAGNSGTAGKPITLRTTVGATINPSSGKPLVITRSYWVVEGFTINAGARSSPAVTFQAPATFSTLRGSHLTNGTYHGLVFDNGSSDNQVLNSEIDHFGLASSSSDAHGVAIHESHNNLIQGNNIHHNMGDAVQVFTIDTPSLYPKSANNNRIIGNTLHDDRENAVDIKSSRGTVVSGNVMYGYQPSANSDGMAVEVHYNAQDVLVANNEIRGSNWGVEVSRGVKSGTAYPVAPKNVTIRNNYIHDLFKVSGSTNTGNGAGIVVREATGVQVWNNTVRNAAGFCVVVTWSGTAAPSSVQLKNNTTGGCGDADLFLKDIAPITSDHNGYDLQGGGRLKKGSTTYTLVAWVAQFGLDAHSLVAAPALLANGNLPTGSPLIDRGVSVGLPFCGAAPDVGAFEANCSAATATRTSTATATSTSTVATTATGTSTATATATRTNTIAATATSTAAATTTRTSTATSTGTASPTRTSTSTAAATATATATPTAGSGALRYVLDGVQGGFIEAEISTGRTGNFVAVSEAGRGNGQYMHTPNGSGTDASANYITYDLDVTNGGAFYLWLLSTGPDSGSDSFWVALDTGADTQVTTGANGAWEWKKLSGALTIPDGRHTLFIRVREDGARVDQIYLSKSSTAPSGVGSPTLTAR